ncbi:type IV pilin protein [Massilia sp. CFBP9012]|uniref:type IV pilin protein n=1 Tax=Massilia sp. CFBP9012 TaxID=3096531 RepID=UPI002A6A4CB7|nr:type IV pilin protein [Massilia sp. CFBP9012]MDY0973617.1 type IV pilin protein [Massilia sp. CFBP9012]
MQRQSGFTLVEIMIAVVIIGILTAVALPSYSSYVMRARLAEAHSTLASTQPKLEQFWANTRSYEDFNDPDLDPQLMPANTDNFVYTLENASATGYQLVATGRAAAADFKYTLTQAGARATTGAPQGWTRSDSCWVDRKDGSCTQ